MYSVSVIMPVYNNEKTLERAIQSILKQTIFDLELILINDGSTDTSAQICEEYAKKEPLLVEVIHQKRTGLGIARNRGLFKASGSYVYFADPKNTFDERMFEDNIQLAEEKNAELVVFGFTERDVRSLEGKKQHLPNLPHLSSRESFRNHYRNFHHFFPYFLCNKLYRRDYLQKHRMTFHKIPLKEAAFFNLSVYKELSRVAFNRTSYCNRSNFEKKENHHYQEHLYKVNIELAKYFEALLRYWKYDEVFRDLIVQEYYHAVYVELISLSTQKTGLSPEQQEARMNEILENEKVQSYLKELKVSNEKNPYMKALLATLQNGNGKNAIQLVTHKTSAQKTTSKIRNIIRTLFRL